MAIGNWFNIYHKDTKIELTASRDGSGGEKRNIRYGKRDTLSYWKGDSRGIGTINT